MSSELFINNLGWTGSVLYLPVIYTLSLGTFAAMGLNVDWVAIGLFTPGHKWITRN